MATSYKNVVESIDYWGGWFPSNENLIPLGPNFPSKHDGGFVSGVPKLKSSETFAKLLNEEFVATPEMMYNFINRTLPNLVSNDNKNNGDITIEMPITVQGNLDEKVLPKLEKMVMNTITNVISQRGMVRNSKAYSI